jgi:hypothetical protein
MEEAYIAAAPAVVAGRIHAPAWPGGLWSDLTFTPTTDRGVHGQHWSVSGVVTGTAEVWLEACGDGTIVHTYLRANPSIGRSWSVRRCVREGNRRGAAARRAGWELKDAIEAGREPGAPSVGSPTGTGAGGQVASPMRRGDRGEHGG